VDQPVEGDKELQQNLCNSLRIYTQFCSIRFPLFQQSCVNLNSA